MTLIILIAIAICLAVLLVHELVTDSRGHRPPPSSYPRDRRFGPPSSRV